jgi:hypothetical protein
MMPSLNETDTGISMRGKSRKGSPFPLPSRLLQSEYATIESQSWR